MRELQIDFLGVWFPNLARTWFGGTVARKSLKIT